MRMEKLKSRASLVGALRHNHRDIVPANADPERVKDNDLQGSAKDALAKYTDLLPKKVRKNAVHAIEIVLTASPEWFENASQEDIGKFANLSRLWCARHFKRQNELSIVMHMDEKTPHIHAIYMPLLDGKLNARRIIGGDKKRMKELQDDFFECVGKELGMERGVNREHVQHTKVSEFSRVMKTQKEALDAREAKFKALTGRTAEQVLETEKSLDIWRNRTPENLRYMADLYEEKKAKNGYDLMKIEAEEKKKEVTQSRGRGR